MIRINKQEFDNVTFFNMDGLIVNNEGEPSENIGLEYDKSSIIGVIVCNAGTTFKILESNYKVTEIFIEFEHQEIIDKAILSAFKSKMLHQVLYNNEIEDISFNTWYLSLEKGRQKALQEDKWMLAESAFKAGNQLGRASVQQFNGEVQIPFFLTDNLNTSDAIKRGMLSIDNNGIEIKVSGYHNPANDDALIYLENAGGELNLRIYDDPENESPNRNFDFKDTKSTT